MLEPFAAQLAIAPPQSFCLAITDTEHDCGIAQFQISILYSPHHFHSIHLMTTHGRPLQQTSSGWRSQSKGTFLNSSEGDIITKFQQVKCIGVLKLFRNVPIINYLEMSPFQLLCSRWNAH